MVLDAINFFFFFWLRNRPEIGQIILLLRNSKRRPYEYQEKQILSKLKGEKKVLLSELEYVPKHCLTNAYERKRNTEKN